MSETTNLITALERQVLELKMSLKYSLARNQELNDIIRGDRPDLFHDSLVRGARVTRMEECISTLKAITKHIDESIEHPTDTLGTIHSMATDVIENNLEFGLVK